MPNWREYGYVSQLSKIISGPSGAEKNAENIQNSAAQAQINTANQQNELQQQNAARALQLEQPAIDQNTALASGSPQAVLAASAPTIAQLSAGFAGAKEQIANTIPPGAARDQALAQLQVQKATTQAGTEANLVQNAPGVLANIGQGLGAFSLQELGASLSGYSGASTSAGNIASEENSAQANKVGLISGLAGAAGGAAGSIFAPVPKGSDMRLKKDITDIGPILDMIAKTRVVRFRYVENNRPEIGVIAQEIGKIFPESVEEGLDGMLYVEYHQLGVVAMAGVAQLMAQVSELKSEVAALKSHISEAELSRVA